jgi:hypothetical protein
LSTTPLDWSEGARSPYYTDQVDWECYGALQLVAAYEEEPRTWSRRRWPKRLSSDWQNDAVLAKRVSARDYNRPRYSQLYGCEIWLPIDMFSPFEAPPPFGPERRFGSSAELLRELERLNDRTFKGKSEDLLRWRQQVPDDSESQLDPRAKTGLSLMLNLVTIAVKQRLPILLDY